MADRVVQVPGKPVAFSQAPGVRFESGDPLLGGRSEQNRSQPAQADARGGGPVRDGQQQSDAENQQPPPVDPVQEAEAGGVHDLGV